MCLVIPTYLYVVLLDCVCVFVFSRLCLVSSCLVLSCLALSCFVLSCFVLPCLVLSCLVLSSLVLSCLVLSCYPTESDIARLSLDVCHESGRRTAQKTTLRNKTRIRSLHVYTLDDLS